MYPLKYTVGGGGGRGWTIDALCPTLVCSIDSIYVELSFCPASGVNTLLVMEALSSCASSPMKELKIAEVDRKQKTKIKEGAVI